MSRCFKCRRVMTESAKHGLHPSCFKEWFHLADEKDDFENINPHPVSSPKNTTFFHGKFKKYSGSLAHKEYILKFSHNDCPELPKTEYLCNEIGTFLGMPIPDFYLIAYSGEDCFLTYNFMQDHQASDLKHIYHFLNDSTDYNIENIIDVIKMRTGRLKEIIYFINICLFDALIGNNDRHGRNLGFISNANGFTLSPCYDNPSYFAMVEENLLGSSFRLSGAIKTRSSDRPSTADYVAEFIRLGYRDSVAAFSQKIKMDAIEALINNSFISEKRKQAFIKYIIMQQEILNNAV